MMMEKMKDASSRADLREKIVYTALNAFCSNGIKSITMDDIAALLKISKRTLYEVFSDKETLLKECIIYHQRAVESGLGEIVANSSNVLEVILKCYKGSIEMYHKVDRRFFEDIKKYPKIHEMISSKREQDNTLVIDFMKKGVEQGIFRADINFAIIHFLLREQMDLIMAESAVKKFPFLEVYEAIILTYLRGISTEKGARELENFIVEYRKEQANQENEKENLETKSEN